MLETLDAAAVRRWCVLARDAVRAHRAALDAVNVYPVADGDTGTNLAATLTSVTDALDRLPAGHLPGNDLPGNDLPATLRAVADGALAGARGNSGLILAALLRGLAADLGDAPRIGAQVLARALGAAAVAAYDAVADPVEGTLLTVAREAAAGATTVRVPAGGTDLAAVVRAARDAGYTALRATPARLAELTGSPVVDAGGQGWCLVLDALVSVVTGEPIAEPVPAPAAGCVPSNGSPAFGYEVQYLLVADDEAIPGLRRALAALGDSVAVVGGGGTYAVHAHVDDTDAAVAAGAAVGRPSQVTVTRFADAVPAQRPGTDRLVVVPALGDGLADVLRSAGAYVVDPGTPPERLPDGDLVLITGAPAGIEGVATVDAASPVPALAALAVHDPAAPFDSDLAAMRAAAAAVRSGRVVATGPGAAASLADGTPVDGDGTAAGCAVALLDRLLDAGGELVTLVTGGAAPPGLAAVVTAHAAGRVPPPEVVTYDGGQHDSLLEIGVE